MQGYLYNSRGVTLAELLIAMTLFVLVATMSITVYAQIIKSQSVANEQRVLVEESRFLLEKIVKELRNGTIDYPQYHADHWGIPYSEYTKQPSDENHPPSIRDGLFIADTSVPPNAEVCGRNCEERLNIINPDGTQQIKIQRNATSDTVEIQKQTVCLNGSEVEWEVTPEYAGDIFLPLNSPSMKVTQLAFYIYPLIDPSKAFEYDEIQYQPTIIIQLSTTTLNGNKNLHLQTTVASRIYDEVRWDTSVTTPCS